MINDDLKNIDKYCEIPKEVSNFLKGLDANYQAGHYEINAKSYANIDIYDTKPVEQCRFEAHKKYIDIQMTLNGFEELDYIAAKELIISEQYDEKRDVMFFQNPSKKSDVIQLSPFKFAMIYPHEAHRPQVMNTNKPEKVKKVVVKILA